MPPSIATVAQNYVDNLTTKRVDATGAAAPFDQYLGIGVGWKLIGLRVTVCSDVAGAAGRDDDTVGAAGCAVEGRGSAVVSAPIVVDVLVTISAAVTGAGGGVTTIVGGGVDVTRVMRGTVAKSPEPLNTNRTAPMATSAAETRVSLTAQGLPEGFRCCSVLRIVVRGFKIR